MLAPHCDDETLACGGLILRAVQVGARVQVVLITNGDGFRAAAEKLTGGRTPRAGDYLRLAARRQQETLAALRLLGLQPSQVAFLGYPDGGTASMWMRNWDLRDLYRSSRTHADHSPYANSFRRGAPYCGRALLDDLETVLRHFRPTIVAIPHAADTHPDHWAAYCYGTAALYELRTLDKVRRLYYAAHERGWPRDPEADVAAFGRWRHLPLTEKEQDRKRQAIECYRSQLAVMRRYLLGFVGRAESFAELEPAPLPSLARGGVRRGRAAGDWWRGLRPAIVRPADRRLPAGANITSTRVCQDGQELRLLIELVAAPEADLACDLHLHYLVRGRVEGPSNWRVDLAHSSSRGATWRVRGRSIEVALPPPPPGWGGVILSIDAVRHHALVDRTRSVLLLR